jgi:hypothetical protein
MRRTRSVAGGATPGGVAKASSVRFAGVNNDVRWGVRVRVTLSERQEARGV